MCLIKKSDFLEHTVRASLLLVFSRHQATERYGPHRHPREPDRAIARRRHESEAACFWVSVVAGVGGRRSARWQAAEPAAAALNMVADDVD